MTPFSAIPSKRITTPEGAHWQSRKDRLRAITWAIWLGANTSAPPIDRHSILRTAIAGLGVGGSFRTRIESVSTCGYSIARKLAVRISIHRLPDGMYEITRKA